MTDDFLFLYLEMIYVDSVDDESSYWRRIANIYFEINSDFFSNSC